MNSSLSWSSRLGVCRLVNWTGLIGLLVALLLYESTSTRSLIVEVESIYAVHYFGSNTSTFADCQVIQMADPINYESGVCYNQSLITSYRFTCNPDGSQSYTNYYDSNCTTPVTWADLPPGSINKCMAKYYYNCINATDCVPTYSSSGLVLDCDGAGTAVTSEPLTGNIYANSFPLSSDEYVTNVQYWSNANCSGEPVTTYANLTNGACITNLTSLDPGAGVRLTCMTDPYPYSSGGKGNVQYVEAWALQPTTCSTLPNMRAWNGDRTQNYGQCMTLRLNHFPYGSYKFICPSFGVTSSSSSSNSSSSSSSGSQVSSSSSTGAVAAASSSSSGPSPQSSSSAAAASSTTGTAAASSSSSSTGTSVVVDPTSSIYDPVEVRLIFKSTVDVGAIEAEIRSDLARLFDLTLDYILYQSADATDNSIILDLYSTARDAPMTQSSAASTHPRNMMQLHQRLFGIQFLAVASSPIQEVELLVEWHNDTQSLMYNATIYPYLSHLDPSKNVEFVTLSSSEAPAAGQTNRGVILGIVITLVIVFVIATFIVVYAIHKRLSSRRHHIESDQLVDVGGGNTSGGRQYITAIELGEHNTYLNNGGISSSSPDDGGRHEPHHINISAIDEPSNIRSSDAGDEPFHPDGLMISDDHEDAFKKEEATSGDRVEIHVPISPPVAVASSKAAALASKPKKVKKAKKGPKKQEEAEANANQEPDSSVQLHHIIAPDQETIRSE